MPTLTPTPPKFILSRAKASDMKEIAELQYRAFPSPFVREVFMGVRTEADLPLLAKSHEDAMAHDRHDVWIKVVDPGTGALVAASNWKVYVNGAPGDEVAEDKAPVWLEGEALERSRRIFERMNAARKAGNPGGFVHLHICFTHPDFRRRGAGRLMMKWGCELADQLFLPMWIEASPDANALYSAFGFYDVECAAGGLMEGTNMRRDARRLSIGDGSHWRVSSK